MLFYLAKGCPNCGGQISDERLFLGLPCESCLPKETLDKKVEDLKEIIDSLKSQKRLRNLKTFAKVEEDVQKFIEVFEEILKVKPSSLQISWAKRFFLGESFAIVAPTGTGKTTFGLLISLMNPGKTLIIVPTKVLVAHLTERLLSLQEKTSKTELRTKKILSYTGSSKEKTILEKGDFDIFVCTQAFFHRNFDLLRTVDFSLIFVDDVDSFLKSGKNVDHLFLLLGFTEEEIQLALKRDKDEEDYEELTKIKERYQKKLKRLIVSSATLKPRTGRAILFQNLLGFEITRFVSSLRKVRDLYQVVETGDLHGLCQQALSAIEVLREGGILFVEESFGREGVEQVTNFFRERGLNVISYLEVDEEELLEQLKSGKVDLAVGLANLGNPLLRGIDLPEVLRYVIFLGVPKHRFPLLKTKEGFELPLSIPFLHNLILSLLPLFVDEERLQGISYLNYLRKYLTMKDELLSQYEGILKRVTEIRDFLKTKLLDPEFIEALRNSDEVFLEVLDDTYYVVIGNAQVYLQGSGRVSRLTARGLLPGLSLLFVENFKAYKSLKKRLRYFLGEEPEFLQVDLATLKKIDEELREERRNLSSVNQDFKNYLIIVESPHKAKTIASFFGKPSKRRIKSLWVYEIPLEDTLLSVCATMGHLFNLSRTKGIFGVISENGHFHPVFDTIKILKESREEIVDEDLVQSEEVFDKGEIIEALQNLAYCSTKTFIASDPDSEGEKIAYDLFISLRPFQKEIKRLEFHEVTPRALRRALENPGDINLHRVMAQLARRVADRWVGFSLSRELWQAFQKRTLSAGRVQTPVLGWVIKRAEEAKSYKYRLQFYLGERPFVLEFEDEELAKKVLSELPELKINILEEFVEDLSPPPPYTTDTILEEAYYYFRYPTSKTMALLQELFELGLITYHRTDSTRISDVGRYQVARPYIEKTLGEDYFYPREWAREGAHEGIRPAHPWDVSEIKLRVAHGFITFREPRDSLRLYDLIFRRFMASQTVPVKIRKGRLEFILPSHKWEEVLPLEIIKSGFDHFWKIPSPFVIPEVITPEKAEIHRVPKVYLYNQGSLIQEMKKRGLGRPSTYAEIVSTLLYRRYIIEIKTGALVPTPLGKKVYEYLYQRFPQFVSEEFTRELEEFMDAVERGEKNWEEICIKLKGLVDEVLRYYLDEN